MIGCGGDDYSDCCGDYITEPFFFVSASPPGGCLPSNGTITVTFDGKPYGIRVSPDAFTVVVSGKTVIISGPFTPGPLALTISWSEGDQEQTLNYTVNSTDPCN